MNNVAHLSRYTNNLCCLWGETLCWKMVWSVHRADKIYSFLHLFSLYLLPSELFVWESMDEFWGRFKQNKKNTNWWKDKVLVEGVSLYIFLLSWKWVKGRLTKVAHATQVGERSTLAAYSEKGLFHTLQKCVKADQYNGKESFNNVRLCVLICFCSRLLGFFLAFSVFIFVLTRKDKGSDLGDGPQLYKLAEVYCAIFLFPVL